MTPQRLGSRYQLEEQVGEGSLGVVWRGTDVSTGAVYAIKVLKPEHALDPATVARFVRERTALLRLRHPNVVVLHDMIVEGDRLALVMDYVADGDLSDLSRRAGGALPLAQAAALTAQICAGLAAAHAAGIVHRDLKPANVLIDRGEARLTDFGIARVTGEPSETTAGFIMGTLSYLPPEVIRGVEPSPAADVYAVGVTLYQLLSGRTPFSGPTAAVMYSHLEAVPPRPDGIPDAVWSLIASCLAKDPTTRPAAAEVAAALLDPALLDPALLDPALGDLNQPASAAFEQWSLIGRRGPAIAAGSFASAALTAAAISPTTIVPIPPSPGQATFPAAAYPDTDIRPAPGGTGNSLGTPRGRRPRRLAWIGGLLAVLAVVGVLTVFLTQSRTTTTDVAENRVTAPGGAAPATTQTDGTGHSPGQGGSASRTTGSQDPTPAASGSGSANPQQPTSGPQPSVIPGQTVKPSSPATASPPAAASSPATASSPASPSPSLSPSPSPSPSASASASAPASTDWRCGPTAPATLNSTGAATGQTLQACDRIHDGRLELEGILKGAITSWHEQIVLVLKDSDQNDYGSYYSPLCTKSDCEFKMSVTPPFSGNWTVLPDWDRYNGNYQSTGHEPRLLYF